jgi:hypothetical protein
MSQTFVVLIVVEVALTAVMVGLWLWRGFLDMKEDDHLLLDDAEAHLQREQGIIRARVNALSRFLVVAGVAWSLLAVAIVGGVIVTELKLV